MPMVLGAGTAQNRGAEGRPRGVTVAGEVKNYVPVTPEMLRNPPPGDWLIFRRNYYGHSNTPLNQITPQNVKNLQLQWVWSMNDSGANQTTPIVHNGDHLSGDAEQHRPGARRQDRLAHLGDARRARSGARLRRHPEHRDRRRQDLPAGQRCAHGGAQRAQRRDSLGHSGVAGRRRA